MKKILCVGPQWRGSNAGGLFRALSRIGHLISVVDENYYINLSNTSFSVKLVDRIFRSWHIKEFNQAILREATAFNPQVVLVYKGAFVLPDTIKQLKQKGYQVVNFYPDVSFHTHGSLLVETLPLFDHVFTTKTFGINDMREQLGIVNSSFIPHGYDPDIHKPVKLSEIDHSYFTCDVSFIGGWSDKKEALLSALRHALPEIDIKIWGGRWENCKDSSLKPCIQNCSILGDLYALGILSSKINLGLLHEQVTGASSGDLITSRTFHIPGAGGFMLHERSSELGIYFVEGKEIECFGNADEMISKVRHYLNSNEERFAISRNGNIRAVKDHSLDRRAELIISILDAR